MSPSISLDSHECANYFSKWTFLLAHKNCLKVLYIVKLFLQVMVQNSITENYRLPPFMFLLSPLTKR